MKVSGDTQPSMKPLTVAYSKKPDVLENTRSPNAAGAKEGLRQQGLDGRSRSSPQAQDDGSLCGPNSTGWISSPGSKRPVDDRSYPRYQKTSDTRGGFLGRLVNAWFLGLITTALLFLALPFCQMISVIGRSRSDFVPLELSRPPPPAPVEAKPPPPIEKEESTAPELIKVQPRLTLSQLELALDPGMGDALGGADFSIDFNTNSLDELELIYNPSEVDRIPRPVHQASPVYPIELKRQGVDGMVVLLFVCNKKGVVKDIKVRSSPNVKFEAAAVRALRKWKFRPGKLDGKSVDVRMLIPFQFDSSR